MQSPCTPPHPAPPAVTVQQQAHPAYRCCRLCYTRFSALAPAPRDCSLGYPAAYASATSATLGRPEQRLPTSGSLQHDLGNSSKSGHLGGGALGSWQPPQMQTSSPRQQSLLQRLHSEPPQQVVMRGINLGRGQEGRGPLESKQPAQVHMRLDGQQLPLHSGLGAGRIPKSSGMPRRPVALPAAHMHMAWRLWMGRPYSSRILVSHPQCAVCCELEFN